ncbi:hypothetical protein ACFL4X_00555 [Gemmatimonadota bacterium]
MEFRFLLWATLLILACGSAGQLRTEKVSTFPIKLGTFVGTREHGRTDLFVYSPWDRQRYAQLTLPEHCWGVNLPNTKHDADPAVASPWQFDADSSAAWYESSPREGVVFRTRARADSMALRLTIEIENATDEPVADIRTLVCFKPDDNVETSSRPDGMTAFRDTSHSRTFFPIDGGAVQVHEETHFSGNFPDGDWTDVRSNIVWGINVRGRPDIRTIEDVGWWFMGDHPGRMVDEVADPALVAIRSSEDSTRWLGLIWDPTQVLFCNPRNPCFHSDPAISDCPPHGSTSARGIIFYHEGTFDGLLQRALVWKAEPK